MTSLLVLSSPSMAVFRVMRCMNSNDGRESGGPANRLSRRIAPLIQGMFVGEYSFSGAAVAR